MDYKHRSVSADPGLAAAGDGLKSPSRVRTLPTLAEYGNRELLINSSHVTPAAPTIRLQRRRRGRRREMIFMPSWIWTLIAGVSVVGYSLQLFNAAALR